VHAWYPDVLDEILSTLSASGIEYRLIVTTAPQKREQIEGVLARRGAIAELEVAENRGRDILPFLRVAYRLREEGEDVVLKLHTKHSPHRNDGQHWRAELLERLLPSGNTVRIIQTFADDPTVGLVYPDGHLQPLNFYWGANENNVRYVTARVGIDAPHVESDSFVSGSMFWLRLDVLAPLLDAHLDEWEFEPEAHQLDGTFAHAIERVFTLCANHRQLKVIAASQASGQPAPPIQQRYAYAQRS